MLWGWKSLRCVPSTSALLVLRTVLTIVDGEDGPSKQLALYFSGPVQRALLQTDAIPPGVPGVDVPPPFYRSALSTLRSLQALSVVLDIREKPVTRLAEALT